MAKVTTLFLFFATILAMASAVSRPAPQMVAQEQHGVPTPLHSLTGVAFHASAIGF
jgi:hypothetical protein